MPLWLHAQTGPNTSERVSGLEARSRSLENTDVTEAVRLATEALKLSGSDPIVNERLTGWIGHLKRFEADYDSANYYLNRAVDLAKEQDLPTLANHYNELGMIHRQQGRLTESMKLHLDALAISQDKKTHSEAANSLYNVGFVFYMQTNYDTAMRYFKQSQAVRESIKDTVGLATSYNGVGLIFLRKENYDSARSWFMKGLSLIDEKRAPRVMAILYNNIGITYEDQDRYEESRKYYYKSLALKESYNDKRGMSSTYGNLADGFRQTGDFKEAIRTTKIGMDLARQTKSLDYLITSYKRLWLCYRKTGDYELALENHERFMDLQDSLFNESKGRQISELMAQYAVAKKEKENAVLKEAMILNESALSRQRIITTSTVGGLIVVVLLLYVLYRYYTKSKNNETALGIEKAKVDGINTQLQEVLKENESMVNVMVHDLRSPLNKVSGLADLVRREGGLSENQSAYLKMTGDVANHGLRIIEDLFAINQRDSLHVERIDLNEFLANVKKQFEAEASAKQLVLTLNKQFKPTFISTDKESLQRILDNLLSNAIKFSPGGKEVKLSVDSDSDTISISVADQGAGFSEEDRKSLYQKFKKLSARPTAGESSTGLGLAIVKQLVEHIGADIQMQSDPGMGTTFTVVFRS